MRIVHLLSYLSAEGAYGGPVAVAATQCAGLAARGHDVTLVTGWDGIAQLEIDGVETLYRRAHRLPGLGFGALTSPALVRTALRLARRADVIHAHLARDFAVLPSTQIVSALCPFVVQPHGMIRPANTHATLTIDKLMTRTVLSKAKSVLCLTCREVEELPQVAGGTLPITRIQNAVSSVGKRARGPLPGEPPEVLFLARLHQRKRPLDFVKMADILIRSGTSARFSMIGPDEGQRRPVEEEIAQRGLSERITIEGALPPGRVRERMGRAALYVLPSVDEPFPMSVLEALSLGIPAVITTETGISAELSAARGGIVVDPNPAALARGVNQVLADPQGWQKWSDRAYAAAKSSFAPSRMLDTLEEAYQLSVRDSR